MNSELDHSMEIVPIEDNTDNRSISPQSTENDAVPSSSTSDSNENDFQLECPSKDDQKGKKRKKQGDEDDEDEGRLCPICFDYWTNCGPHRVCALKCGHLFGYSCAIRWLSAERTCPSCKRLAAITDIRFIYVKKLIATDTVELTQLKLEIEKEKCDKIKLEIQLAIGKHREEVQKNEIQNLKDQIDKFKTSNHNASDQSANNPKKWKIFKLNHIEISKNGGCRVMTCARNSDLLVVSAPSSIPLFSGFGVRKVNIPYLRNLSFIPLHTETIRDVSFHPEQELLLSVATDKFAKLTESSTNKSVLSINCDGPIWSCLWDVTNMNHFYIGKQSGCVMMYDMRRANEKLKLFQIPNDYSPVVSIASVKNGVCPGGIIVCKLNSCTLFNPVDDNIMIPLATDGPFISMKYDNYNGHVLLSSRPTTHHHFTRHTFRSIIKTENNISCNTIRTFEGGAVQNFLSRSCFMNVKDDVLIAAHQEANRVVDIWSTTTGKKLNSMSTYMPITDLCPISPNGHQYQYLCALSDKKVDFFKLQL